LLSQKKVLLSPAALDGITDHELNVNATVNQIKNSPDIDTERPISRQKEEELHNYYTWSYYWGYPLYYNSLGAELYPNIQYVNTIQNREADQLRKEHTKTENHLRSTHEISGYNIDTKGGEFGYLDDFLIDIKQWVVRYLVLNTGDILPGRKVLVAAHFVKQISWENRSISFDFNIDTLRNGPTYDPSVPLTRDFERRVYEYYEKNPYWI
jgi:hypothetical protein